MSVIVNVARTVVKLVRGRPHDRDMAVGLGNAFAALNFLAGLKVGAKNDARLRLGYNGRRHEWSLQRREDLTVLEEVFLDEDYDVAIAAPSVVFDLGANIGAASVYFALRWPEARIFAVEPSPEMFARLRATTAGYSTIRCIACAAGASDNAMRFTLSQSSVGGGLFRHEAGAEVINVSVRSLVSLMAECGVDRVDLLKFDIEGAESLLFQDPSILDRIGAFVGEVHPDLMTESEENFLARFCDFETHRRDLPAGRFLLSGTRRQP